MAGIIPAAGAVSSSSKLNPFLRGMRKLQGVASQAKPLEVVTLAPGGVLSTAKSWLVPRTTVAQAGSVAATPASASACTPRRAKRLEIMKSPKRNKAHPPGGPEISCCIRPFGGQSLPRDMDRRVHVSRVS